MPLSEYQFQVGAVVMGTGTVYFIDDVQGFGLGEKRDRRHEIPGADGAVWGREYRQGPTVTFEGVILCEQAPSAAYTALQALRTAFDGSGRTSPRTTEALKYRWPGQAEQTVQGRPSGLRVSMRSIVVGRVPFTATFDVSGQLT